MARIYTVLVIIGVAVAFSEACTSSSGRTPSWDIGDNSEIYPTYDPSTESVGVGVEIRFRRSIESQQQEVFNLIDRSRDGFIDVSEWTTEGGSLHNFMTFLHDDDKDGDERISFEEFPAVKRN